MHLSAHIEQVQDKMALEHRDRQV